MTPLEGFSSSHSMSSLNKRLSFVGERMGKSISPIGNICYGPLSFWLDYCEFSLMPGLMGGLQSLASRLIRSPAFRFIFVHWFRTGILNAHPVFDGE